MNVEKEAVPLERIDQNEKVTIWKQYEDGYIVRSMRLSETNIPLEWFSAYDPIKDEIRLCFEIFTEGPYFYIGEFKGNIVASWMNIPWGNDIFYGGYYYVAKEFRCRGFGTRMRDQVSLARIGNNISVMDAVLGDVTNKNISRFGYENRLVTQYYLGTAKCFDISDFTMSIVSAKDVEFDNLVEYDNKWFISRDNPQRRDLLKKFLDLPDSGSYVAIDNNAEIKGCGFKSASTRKDHVGIGPLYADSLDIAEALMKKLLNDIPKKTYTINIYKENKATNELVKRFELKLSGYFIRQHLRGNFNEFKNGVFAVTSMGICGF